MKTIKPSVIKPTAKELTERGMFYFQMQIVAADYLKVLTEYVLTDKSIKHHVKQEVKQSMNDMKKALNLYASRINGRDAPVIGVCSQFSDTLIEFLSKTTKGRKEFEEVFGLMSAYNNGEINIVD